MSASYHSKFEKLQQYHLYRALPELSRSFIEKRAFEYQLSQQQFYELVKCERDLEMWGESTLMQWWEELDSRAVHKDEFIRQARNYVENLRNQPPDYSKPGITALPEPSARSIRRKATDRKIYGECPVASDETVCCNLKTIDAVENCPLGCSYCSIQTFYSDHFVVEENLKEKLNQIPIDPHRKYHFGTGQSSDSLVWGNRNGMLEDLVEFAHSHPNVLLEFKTKTNNVDDLLSLNLPSNIVVSWSLNTSTIVNKEEHFTASLEKRLASAKKVAEQGIPIAFHFHPIIYYDQWQTEYTGLVSRVKQMFNPSEVLFISMGTLTLIQPAIKRIRELGFPTKILQFPLDRDPHGKITYPEDLKVELFETLYQSFGDWHDHVYFYLCMETATIWQKVFGFYYPTNEEFEADFLDHNFSKIEQNFRPTVKP